MPRKDKPAFISDMDDSLIVCGPYYEECKTKFADYMETQLGMPRDSCLARFAKINLETGQDRKIDFESRFPMAMVKLYKEWCDHKGIETTQEQELEVAKIGFSVYDSPFEPMPDAHNMLYELSPDYDLYLFTKGSQDRQVKKILNADLDPYFKGVWITDQKTLKTLTVFMLKAGLNIRSTWVLGNSPANDLLPAAELGIPPHNLIWIDSYMWDEDKAPLPKGAHTITSLSEVVPITRKIIIAEGATYERPGGI